MQWPQNKTFAVCLSHDVDRIQKQWYHYLYYAYKKDAKRQWDSLKQLLKGKEPYFNFESILKLEGEYGVKSTFFFMDESHRELDAKFMGRYRIHDKRLQAVFREIVDNGWEIGLHGSYFSFENESLMKREKEILEDLARCEIVSVRQHHLNRNDETWSIQRKCNLKYDSSVGSAAQVADETQLRPYYTKEGILEIPISLMDKVHQKNQTETERQFDVLMKKASQSGGVLTLDFHQCYLQKEYCESLEFYKQIIEKALKMGAWVTNMREIGQYIEENLKNETV